MNTPRPLVIGGKVTDMQLTFDALYEASPKPRVVKQSETKQSVTESAFNSLYDASPIPKIVKDKLNDSAFLNTSMGSANNPNTSLQDTSRGRSAWLTNLQCNKDKEGFLTPLSLHPVSCNSTQHSESLCERKNLVAPNDGIVERVDGELKQNCEENVPIDEYEVEGDPSSPLRKSPQRNLSPVFYWEKARADAIRQKSNLVYRHTVLSPTSFASTDQSDDSGDEDNDVSEAPTTDFVSPKKVPKSAIFKMMKNDSTNSVNEMQDSILDTSKDSMVLEPSKSKIPREKIQLKSFDSFLGDESLEMDSSNNDSPLDMNNRVLKSKHFESALVFGVKIDSKQLNNNTVENVEKSDDEGSDEISDVGDVHHKQDLQSETIPNDAASEERINSKPMNEIDDISKNCSDENHSDLNDVEINDYNNENELPIKMNLNKILDDGSDSDEIPDQSVSFENSAKYSDEYQSTTKNIEDEEEDDEFEIGEEPPHVTHLPIHMKSRAKHLNVETDDVITPLNTKRDRRRPRSLKDHLHLDDITSTNRESHKKSVQKRQSEANPDNSKTRVVLPDETNSDSDDNKNNFDFDETENNLDSDDSEHNFSIIGASKPSSKVQALSSISKNKIPKDPRQSLKTVKSSQKRSDKSSNRTLKENTRMKNTGTVNTTGRFESPTKRRSLRNVKSATKSKGVTRVGESMASDEDSEDKNENIASNGSKWKNNHEATHKDSEEALEVKETLLNWYIVPSRSTIKIQGDRLSDGQLWSSGNIRSRVNSQTVKNASGSLYKISGKMNTQASIEHGFPSIYIHDFLQGIPVNWRSLIRSNPVKAEKTKRILVSNINDTKKASPMISTSDLKKTRSGRMVKPQLAWWTGQRVKYCAGADTVEIVQESANSLVGTPNISFTQDKRQKRLREKHVQNIMNQSRRSNNQSQSIIEWSSSSDSDSKDNEGISEEMSSSKSETEDSSGEIDSNFRSVKKLNNSKRLDRQSEHHSQTDEILTVNKKKSPYSYEKKSRRSHTKAEMEFSNLIDSPKNSKRSLAKVYENQSNTAGSKNKKKAQTKRNSKNTCNYHPENNTVDASINIKISNSNINVSGYNLAEDITKMIDDRRSKRLQQQTKGRKTCYTKAKIEKENTSGSNNFELHDDYNVKTPLVRRPQRGSKTEARERIFAWSIPDSPFSPEYLMLKTKRNRNISKKVIKYDDTLESDVEKDHNFSSLKPCLINSKPKRKSSEHKDKSAMKVREKVRFDTISNKERSHRRTRTRSNKSRPLKEQNDSAQQVSNTAEDGKDIWNEEETERLYRAVKSIPATRSMFWHEVAKKVGSSKSAEHCQEFYQGQGAIVAHPSKHHKKVPAPKEKKEVGQLTGKAGTMKRKRQLRELMEEHDKAYEEDMFEATPFKKKKIIQIPNLDESDDDFDNLDSGLTPGEKYRTPKAGIPARLLRSERRTPHSSMPTPAFLKSVNRYNADLYINKLKNARKGRAIHRYGKEHIERQSQSDDTSVKLDMNRPIFDEDDHMEENANDSDQQADYYYSDDD
ncbi:unnamed protein product [Owenia fusiformis]|uniref:Myb-like domain-containing protein n=1 Tax=Owenia fusiformis TaxID=6347 RepID=A0A8S4PEL6_OWEFU|nr:unnamed protein product [Owenia fusiformis]